MELEFDHYLTQIGHSKMSRSGEVSIAKRFHRWLKQEHIPEGQISYNDVMSFIEVCRERGCSASTLQSYSIGLKHYLNHLVEEGILTQNPIHTLTIKGVKRQTLYQILHPEQLDQLYQEYPLPPEQKTNRDKIGYQKELLAYQRDRCMVGLLVYQGITSHELSRLETNHIHIREGKVFVPGSRSSNARTLELKTHQALDLQEYLIHNRPIILDFANKETERLFLSLGGSDSLANVMTKVNRQLKEVHPEATPKLIRASVITNWLKNLNMRQAQYRAGHRFLSSTEKYMKNDLEGMQEDIDRFHPLS